MTCAPIARREEGEISLNKRGRSRSKCVEKREKRKGTRARGVREIKSSLKQIPLEEGGISVIGKKRISRDKGA